MSITTCLTCHKPYDTQDYPKYPGLCGSCIILELNDKIEELNQEMEIIGWNEWLKLKNKG